MNTVILLLLLFQSADDGGINIITKQSQRRETQLRLVAEQLKSGSFPEGGQAAAVRDQKFIEKFNKLCFAIAAFADSYSDEQTIDLRKAKAIRKAWIELEKSEPIFQEGKKK